MNNEFTYMHNTEEVLLKVQRLECSGSNIEVYLLANWEPVQVDHDWWDVTVTRLLNNDTSKGVLNQLKTGQIKCRCASADNYNRRLKNK